jgi:hypothetical protein
MPKYFKPAFAISDYPIDWSDWLGTDTILTSVWVLPDDLTLVASSITNANKATVARISGGVDGCQYTVKNQITTAIGLADERQITLVMAAVPDASTLKEILDAIDAMVKGKATLDQKSYVIGNRQLERYPIPDLLMMREKYARLYAEEQRKIAVGNGASPFKSIFTRFTKPL